MAEDPIEYGTNIVKPTKFIEHRYIELTKY